MLGSLQGVQGVINPAVVEECPPETSGIGVECVKVQPRGKHILVLLASGSIRLWDTETKVRHFFPLSLHVNQLSACSNLSSQARLGCGLLQGPSHATASAFRRQQIPSRHHSRHEPAPSSPGYTHTIHLRWVKAWWVKAR